MLQYVLIICWPLAMSYCFFCSPLSCGSLRNFSADTTVEQIFICLTIFIAYFQALVDTNFSQEPKKIQKALKSFRETFALRDSAKQGPSHSAYIF